MNTNQFLSNAKLRRKFSALLAGIMLFAWILLFAYSRYSLNVTEQQFNQRAVLLAETMGAQSQYGLMMGDATGLSESLNNVISA